MPRIALKAVHRGSFARRLAAAGVLLASLALAQGCDAREAGVPIGDGFDFYVLSLSWSPSYCAVEGKDASRQQCASDRPYAFIVHGLWPQFERGFPEDCRSDEPSRVPRELAARMLDLIPSVGLVGYQWRKHGTCSGLGQSDYFSVMRAARERIMVPAQFQNLDQPRSIDPEAVETAFIEANRGLTKSSIAVTCDNRYLREVRICLTKGLDFRTCPNVDRASCRLPAALMPPNRGG